MPVAATHLVPLLAASGQRPIFWLFVVAGIGVAVGAQVVRRRRERAIVASLGRLAERHPGWHRQVWPAGITTDLLVSRFSCTPRGDRRYGVEHGVGGTLELEVSGQRVTCQVACFRWFHEQRHRNRSSGRARTSTYERRFDTVVLCQLPTHTHRGIKLLPPSALGRVGLTRAGLQLESDAFNRAFVVESSDEDLVVRLLDAGLQELLATHYRGRGVELSDDLLVLSGEPSHRDRSLQGPIQTYPAILQDLSRLVRHIPPAFWRRLGLHPEPDAPPRPPTPEP